MGEALKALGLMVGVVIALTMIGGGKFNLGTSSAGPYVNFGYTGPSNKG